MSSSAPKPACKSDIVPIARMLTQAFINEPGLSWMIPNVEIRWKVLPGFFRGIVRGTFHHGSVLHTPDNNAATLWRFADRTNPGFFEVLSGVPFMVPFLRQGGSRTKVISQAVREHALRFPFRYLQFAGVLPASQGKGIGGAVIRAGLEEAALKGGPVYLETPKPENVALYSNLGFDVIGEWDVEGSGLRFTSMLKRP